MISKKYRILIERRLARLEKAVNEGMRCESLDDIDEMAHDWFVSQEWDEDDYWVKVAGGKFEFIQNIADKAADPVVDACCDAIGVDTDSPERDIVENSLANAADTALVDPGYWDDDDDYYDDDDEDEDDGEDDMYESRRRKLEWRVKRLNNTEVSRSKKSLKKEYRKRTNERGLLRGVVGKVKANGEDAEAIAAILKDKYKIPENLITAEGDKHRFKLYISFYDKNEQDKILKAVAEKVKNDLAKESFTHYYIISLSESEKDKMNLKLEKIANRFYLNPNSGGSDAWKDWDYKGKEEVLEEVSGLSMASYDKLAKQMVDMVKKNVDPQIVSNMCDYKEVGKIIGEGLWDINKEYAQSVIDKLKSESLFKKVKWTYFLKDGSILIQGKFHIDNGKNNLETGTYTVKIILRNDTIEMYHLGVKDKYSDLKYKQGLTGNFAKDFDKAVVQCIPNSRGKIEAGEMKW